MAEAKTKPTEKSVDSFLETIADEPIRQDCYAIITLMEKTTGEKAKMWGPAIIGFGKYSYRYDSGRSGEICLAGFSPRKANITLYVLPGFPGQDELLQKLGKYKTGKSCLYIKKLNDINVDILELLIKHSVDFIKEKYPGED
jgi:hypothetical protein